MRLPLLLTLCTTLPLALSATSKPKVPKNAILLSQVKSLTLRHPAKTTHRRVPPIQQLTCKGPGCAHHTISIMRCTNGGSDYETEDVQWSCVADVPAEFKLGSTDVICEGYAGRDDEYVLKGSCGVEYRLLLTEAGEEKYGSGNGGWFGGGKTGKKSKGDNEEGGSTFGAFLFMAVFFGVAGWILYSMYLAYIGNANPNALRFPRRPGGFWGGGWGGGPGGGGGGGGGGGWDDPPPPYPGKRPYTTTPQPGQQGYRPGFWTGALGGAAAGYMAGNRGNNRQPDPVQRGGGGWFGGGADNGEGSSNWGSTPRRPSPRTSSSSSSARHSTTGFGSTSRR